MTPRHINIPLFIPHMGCPNQCVFCDQRLISGTSCFREETVAEQIEACLSTVAPGTETEIAFFGGSFTGIERGLMVRLLERAESYVRAGRVRSIRMSTRPDYIDPEILSILSRYTVSMVELGIQSFSDTVLAASRRGHTAADTKRACALLRQAHIPLGAQMMVGLPGATPEDEIFCAKQCVEEGAAAYRVYPTIVFQGTELANMTAHGVYAPLTVEEAAFRMARVMEIFAAHDVPCLRAGLCESENLHTPTSFAAGPNHPAIGELARGEIFFARMCALVEQSEDVREKNVVFFVPMGKASMAAGQNRRNILRICRNYGIKSVKIIEKSTQIGYNIRMEISTSTSITNRKENRHCD